jgi:hypothetical protein
MKDVSVEIARLCERCRDHVADSTKSGQPRYAEELLRLLDWEQPLPFTPREVAAAHGATTYLLRGGGQTNVGVFFLPPGLLDPPSSHLARGLDFCPVSRDLVREARECAMHYVLISDFHRSLLFDPKSEELLLHADDPRAFNESIAPVLRRAQVERGVLEEVRRQPRSAVARDLREWCQRWIDTFVQDAGLPVEAACLVLDRLITVGYLFDHEILRRTKWRLEQRFRDLVARASGPQRDGVGQALVKLFHDMGLDWRMDLFACDPALDAALARDGFSAPLLREFGLLSRNKFHLATILESFNHGEAAEKLRVRMVPDENDERDRYLARQSLESIDQARIEIDLMEEGYRALFHWFDRVVALYDRLENEFDARTYRSLPQAQELDLLDWSDIDATRPGACGDKLAYACEHGFGVYYSGPRQYRIARLLLTLHVIGRYHQFRQPVERFPSFAKVFLPRPKLLNSQYVMRASSTLPLSDDPLNYPMY